MSDTPDVTETEPQATEQQPTELPADHPLVKTLAAQKAQLKEYKAKASSYDELVEAQKSDGEKAADRISKAEAEAASVPAKVCEALRKHFVDSGAVDAERAELFLTATDPEVLLKQVNALVGESDKRKKNHVPREGNPTPKSEDDDVRELARNLFG